MKSKKGKGTPKPQNKGQSQGGETLDNPSKSEEKNNITNTNKDRRKCCEFQKSPTLKKKGVVPSSH